MAVGGDTPGTPTLLSHFKACHLSLPVISSHCVPEICPRTLGLFGDLVGFVQEIRVRIRIIVGSGSSALLLLSCSLTVHRKGENVSNELRGGIVVGMYIFYSLGE